MPMIISSNMAKLCTSSNKVIMSGIQPTGIPHLGNYLGAIRQCVRLQHDPHVTKLYLCIVDLHALTTNPSKDELSKNILDMTASLLASGIDPDKAILFQQSSVRGHTDLSWILSSFCNIKKLEQLPQWREKSVQSHKAHNASLLTYPVLQAADILLYRATHVPVGEDQLPHIELTRDLVQKIRGTYNKLRLIEPREILSSFPRIRDLKNPEKKMSKSDSSSKGRIELTDPDDVIQNKIKGAITDSSPETISYEPDNRSGLASLIDLYSILTDRTVSDVIDEIQAIDKLNFKLMLASAVNEELGSVRESLEAHRRRPEYLVEVLEYGRERAQRVADDTLRHVYDCVGLNLSHQHARIKQSLT